MKQQRWTLAVFFEDIPGAFASHFGSKGEAYLRRRVMVVSKTPPPMPRKLQQVQHGLSVPYSVRECERPQGARVLPPGP
jgi:hypothetical protein